MSTPLMYEAQNQQEWESLFTECKAERLASIQGARFVRLATQGKSFERRVRPRSEVEIDLGKCINALQALDPATYGNPTNNTHADFSSYQFK